MKTMDEKLAVMRAWLEGKAIECRTHGLGKWVKPDPAPSWMWGDLDYRVAEPEPRPVNSRRVPLDERDFAGTTWIKPILGVDLHLVTAMYPRAGVSVGTGIIPFSELMRHWLRSTHGLGSAAWQPCWKETQA